MKLIVFLVGLLLGATAAASPPIHRNWSYAKIESDSISIEIRTDSRMRKIEMLRVVQDGKSVAIPEAVYRQAEHPLINELRIEACESTDRGTCSVLFLPFVDQRDDVPLEDAVKEVVIELVEGRLVRHGVYPAQRVE